MIERIRRFLWSKKIRHPRLVPPRYINRHAGQPFLVLGAGPTLRDHGQRICGLIAERHPVLLSANAAGLEFSPHYVSFINRRRFCERASVVTHGTSLIGPHIPKWIIRRYCVGAWERLPWVNTTEPFGIQDGIVQCDCGMSAALLLAVALVMGASEVWTAGVDGYAVGEAANAFLLQRPEHDFNRALETQGRMKIVLPEIVVEYRRRGVGGPWSLTPTRFVELKVR